MDNPVRTGPRLALFVACLLGCEAPVVPVADRSVPVADSIAPAVAVAGSRSTSFSLRGSGLYPESVVRVDGQPVPTTYVDTRELDFELSTELLVEPAVLWVSVFTPPPGGGVSQAVRLIVEPAPPPAASLITAFEPSHATQGSSGFTLTIRGRGFGPDDRLRWNGAERPTQLVSSSELRVEVQAADLLASGAAALSVVSSGSSGGFVGGFPILPGQPWDLEVRTLALSAVALAADPARDVIYAAVSAAASDSANRVLAVDPGSGTVLWSRDAGSDPSHLAVSEDGAWLYVGLRGAPRMTRLRLPSGDQRVDIELYPTPWPDLRVQDLSPVAGRPMSVMAALYTPGTSTTPHVGVFVWDDTQRREGNVTLANHVEPSVWSSRAYGFYNESTGFEFKRLTLRPDGVVVDGSSVATQGFGTEIHHDEGLVVSTRGELIDAEALTIVGTYAQNGVVRPDVRSGRTHWFSGETLTTVHYSAFTVIGTTSIPAAAGTTVMVRFGADGLALGGGAAVVFVSGPLIGP